MSKKIYIIESAFSAEIIAAGKVVRFNRIPVNVEGGVCAIITDEDVQEAIENRNDFGSYIRQAEVREVKIADERKSTGDPIQDSVTSLAKAKVFLSEQVRISDDDKQKLADLLTAKKVKDFAKELGYEFPNWK